MSARQVTDQQIRKWFDTTETALKDRLISTSLDDKELREQLYYLYQASQLLKANFLEDFTTVVIPQQNTVV